MKLTYTEAKVFFPGGEPFKINEDFVSGDSVYFKMNNNLIIAKIKPYYIPQELSDHPETKKLIIEPIKEMMPSVLRYERRQISKLKELTKEGKVNSSFRFSIVYRDHPLLANKFVSHLYDSSKKVNRPNCFFGETGENLFDILFRVKDVDKRILQKSDRALVDLAEYLGKDEFGDLFIVGETLEEAIDKAVCIYDIGEILKNFL